MFSETDKEFTVAHLPIGMEDILLKEVKFSLEKCHVMSLKTKLCLSLKW